ncbi:AMP-dependent synthetase/ligase [Penicillium robsamsonii]|uniref:AMP-dependent synthetase/ligase n=1 Tax=Penicillium robsamsonii TaxID=1792511 RepID=UPI002548FF69|nr:AMP-dependent synthetase/ligase [Penicillium robsamsonii]KAJ5813115.1 AMP-dependent synthetase/ligase [Penicillium robsamsonii]
MDIKSVDLVSYLFSNPLNTPLDRPLYIDAISGKQYTLGDVIQRTRSLSNGLRQSIGVEPNDVVALLSPNTIDYPVVCHAIIGSRAIVSPTSAALTALELNAQLKTSGARFIIVHSSLLETAQKAAQGTSIEKIVLIDGQSPVNGQPTCNHLASTFAPDDFLAIDPSEADNQPAFICFSSGTSGAAKGVVTTHKNITSNIQQWRHYLDGGLPSQRPARKSAVAFLPFSHIYGFNLFMCQCLMWGTTVAVMTKFDLDLYLSCIQKYRPDELSLVPPIALLLVKDPRVSKYDLSSVRKIMSAAAPLTIELASALEAKLTAIAKTERNTGVGCLAPNMQLRFVDPESMKDAAVKVDGSTEAAEIWCRGPNVVGGYYNNDKATEESYHVDEDGTRWFRTGDIGTIDRDGYVAILDRIKEMIKYKGLQVIPSELEGKLVDHPDVEDAAVTGMWVEDRATELPVGFVVLSRQAKDRDQKAVLDGIHAWLNERVSNHKRLRGGIQVLSQIPKSPSGKILRRELRDLLKSQVPKARL